MKNNIIKSIIITAAFLTAIELFAQQDTILTASQCVEMALQNNRQSQTARNNVESAVSLSREAFTKYFPEISAAGMVFWANHDILQYNLLDIIELGLIKKGKVAGVQALQPVFMGGLIVNGNKLAHVGEEVARLRKEQTDNELKVSTESLYWKLATLKSSKKVVERAIETLDSLTEQVSVAVDAGLVTRNDLLKVQLKRNTYSTELIDLENGIKLVKMLLSQYVGLGISGNIEVEEQLPEAVPEMPYELYLPTADALHQTVDYRLLQKNIDAKKLEKRLEIGSNLPSVLLGAGWYYHDLLEQNHNFGSLQIAVEVPLSGWWGGSYGIKRRDIALNNAKLEMEDLSEKLQIEMQDKWNNLTAAHRKMEVEAEGITQSAENLRLNKLYYEAGMSTITDLLEAETEYSHAGSRYATAYGEFQVAKAEYLISTGR